jgi:prepilin-type N-terminal cleavage/methylation domain-containing protein
MKKGFSLIELLVVIAITAVLTAIALPNFLSARERARDAKRKQEMQEMKNSLRLYYNDYQTYPIAANGGIGKLNYISGCGADAATMCPCTSATQNADFAVGTACETVYMKRFPSEFGSRIYYSQYDAGNDFCLKAALENAADPDILTSRCRCANSCGVVDCMTATGTDYYVCAD